MAQVRRLEQTRHLRLLPLRWQTNEALQPHFRFRFVTVVVVVVVVSGGATVEVAGIVFAVVVVVVAVVP